MRWRIVFEDGSVVLETAATIGEAITAARLDRTLADIVREHRKTREHVVIHAGVAHDTEKQGDSGNGICPCCGTDRSLGMWRAGEGA